MGKREGRNVKILPCGKLETLICSCICVLSAKSMVKMMIFWIQLSVKCKKNSIFVV